MFIETDLRLSIVEVKGDLQRSSSQPLLVEQEQICCYRVLSGLVQSAHPHLAEDYWLAKGHLADVRINIRPSAREVHCQIFSFRESDSPLWLCLNHISLLLAQYYSIRKKGYQDTGHWTCALDALSIWFYIFVLHLESKSLLHFESSNSVCHIFPAN